MDSGFGLAFQKFIESNVYDWWSIRTVWQPCCAKMCASITHLHVERYRNDTEIKFAIAHLESNSRIWSHPRSQFYFDGWKCGLLQLLIGHEMSKMFNSLSNWIVSFYRSRSCKQLLMMMIMMMIQQQTKREKSIICIPTVFVWVQPQ